MSSEIVYRRATSADSVMLANLRMEFLAEVSSAAVPADLEPALVSYFQRTLPTDEFIAPVATLGDEIIATSGLVCYSCPPSNVSPTGRLGYLINMYTRPQWRRRGIAARLLRDAIAAGREMGCYRISLHTEPLARSVYARAGFTPTEHEMRLVL